MQLYTSDNIPVYPLVRGSFSTSIAGGIADDHLPQAFIQITQLNGKTISKIIDMSKISCDSHLWEGRGAGCRL